MRDGILGQTALGQGRLYRTVWQTVLINRYLSQVLIICEVNVTLHIVECFRSLYRFIGPLFHASGRRFGEIED